MSVRRHTKNNLVGRHTSRSPSRNSGNSGTLFIAGGGAGVVQGRVGSGDAAEGAKDVIVHDLWNEFG